MSSRILPACVPQLLCAPLLLCLWAPATAAEELGLDLSETTASEPQGLGLDLSEPKGSPTGGLGLDLSEPALPAEPGASALEATEPSGRELRPSIGFVGIDAPPELGAKASAHVRRLREVLAPAAGKLGSFAHIVDPSGAAEQLEDGYADALRCSSAKCFADLAEALDVDRVVTARYATDGGGPALELWGFDRGPQTILPVKIESRGSCAHGFDRCVAHSLRGLLESLSTELGTLTVTVDSPSALVTLGQRNLGFGSQERAVPAGSYRLTVIAEGYTPFETQVTVPQNGAERVVAKLIPLPSSLLADSPPLDEVPRESARRPLWEHPGFYLGLAGAVATGTGVGFGLAAKALEKQSADAARPGVLGISRAQMLAAQRDALLANVLVGAGVAMLTGGTVWVLAQPAQPARTGGPAEPAVAWAGVRGSF